ncbi:glutathione S-transferase [Undibacterium sp.]|uniref:glutathione S-transferase n=1 Tax=Undibacterium sp. TaxID=1914977 RepID=UPI002B81E9ED|nr:glutathione S-transferase [Undibacterium sp.]HTD03616.1 glutathione S-transferase [Undibacterium sp.]
MPLPVLYSFRRCPYAMRARLALKYAAISVELREVALRNKPAEMLALSPKATVPVLQLPDGAVIDQSIDIMRWALSLHDPAGWLPDEAAAEAAERLIAVNDGPFKTMLDRYKYAGRYPEHSAETYRDQAVDLQIAPLNERLGKTRYLLGDRLSLADMAVFPFVRQFAHVDPDWFDASPYRAANAWMNDLLASPLFEAAMAKFAPWQPGDAAIVF